jgi:hypothetical protein
MTEFIAFRHKSTGVVAYYPEHYIDHPVFGYDLEVYKPEEYEEDKVVVEGHDLPVDQRAVVVAVPLADMTKDELVSIADEHGLETKGTKAELIERLAADNTKEES